MILGALESLFSRTVEDVSILALGGRSLAVDSIKAVPALAEKVYTNGVQVEH
jgi:hypothetical protein